MRLGQRPGRFGIALAQGSQHLAMLLQ